MTDRSISNTPSEPFAFWEGESLPREAVPQDVLDQFEPRMTDDEKLAMLAPAPPIRN